MKGNVTASDQASEFPLLLWSKGNITKTRMPWQRLALQLLPVIHVPFAMSIIVQNEQIYYENKELLSFQWNKFSELTLPPIWLPHWPAWMWTISLMLLVSSKTVSPSSWCPIQLVLLFSTSNSNALTQPALPSLLYQVTHPKLITRQWYLLQDDVTTVFPCYCESWT